MKAHDQELEILHRIQDVVARCAHGNSSADLATRDSSRIEARAAMDYLCTRQYQLALDFIESAEGLLELGEGDPATERCVYCGADIDADNVNAPDEDNEDAWAKRAKMHSTNCEWIVTRSHSRP